MPPLDEVGTGCRLCNVSGSSFTDDGDGGDSGAGAGDMDGSLESERGGVNSPHTNISRMFCRCAAIFNDKFSAFNFALEFCRYLCCTEQLDAVHLINLILSWVFCVQAIIYPRKETFKSSSHS